MVLFLVLIRMFWQEHELLFYESLCDVDELSVMEQLWIQWSFHVVLAVAGEPLVESQDLLGMLELFPVEACIGVEALVVLKLRTEASFEVMSSRGIPDAFSVGFRIHESFLFWYSSIGKVLD